MANSINLFPKENAFTGLPARVAFRHREVSIGGILLETVDRRFGSCGAPQLIEFLTDNGSPCIALETRTFARRIGRKPGFAPAGSPYERWLTEEFVNTVKRHHISVPLQPDGRTALRLISGWFEWDNESHPQAGYSIPHFTSDETAQQSARTAQR